MRLELITIGNELLSGKTTDTNSAWMAEQFNLLGLKVSRITSVSDSGIDILNILEESGKRSDIVVITGGLGPTSDDITKPVLCEFFDTMLCFNQAIFEHIQSLIVKKGGQINEYNKKQAEIPESAIALHNEFGTAPGLWLEKSGTIFISLPGVPFEMKALMSTQVIPRLKELYSFPVIYYRTVITQGSSEAQLAEELKDFETEMPEFVSLAYLPSPGIIRLRFGATGESRENLEMEINKQIEKLREIIPEYIAGYDDDTLEAIIGNLLKENKLNLSVAESCTGGAIASLITGVPGSSEYFKGGIIAYSNEIKKDQLAIDPLKINKYGAVSKQVVEDMAINVRLLFNSDYSIAVSGIAGPAGGNADKPVGTTWIAVSSRNATISARYLFGDNRERNIRRAAVTALNSLRKLILNNE